PLVLGIFLNIYIYGIVGFQYAAYYSTMYKDPLWINSVGYLTYLIHTFIYFRQAPRMYILWSYCVENFVNPSALNESLWAYSLIPILTGVSGLVAHIFLAHRVYILTSRKILYYTALGVAVSVFVLAGLTGILVLAKQVSMVTRLSSHCQILNFKILKYLAILLAVARSLMVVLLNRRPGFLAGFSTGNRMLRLPIQTGSFAVAFSSLSLVTFAASTNTNAYFLFCVPIGRLYSSVGRLDTLLTRGRMNTMSETNQSGDKANTADIWIPMIRAQGMPSNTISLNNIHIKTEA
ncbi:hypothetical protein BDQ12DRAFT_612391, partial [Crucibulum laeve]